MKKVAIYCRVSTLSQAEDGYSIGEQQDKLNKYCEIMGWEVSEVYTDAGFSGSTIERPAMKKLLRDAENRTFNTILVYKLDRLSRSTSDNLYLIKEVFKKNEIEFVSLNEKIDTSDAMGEFFFTLLAAVAEMERKTITERMALGRLGRAKSGKTMAFSTPPYGYKRTPGQDILEIVPQEAKIVQKIFTDYMGGKSVATIRQELNEKGYSSRKGKWPFSTIRNMLENTVYIAKGKFKGKTYEQEHEKIISEELFWAVQDELKKRQIKQVELTNVARPFRAKYMLSGLLKCGYCGGHITSLTGPKRLDGTSAVRYECVRRKDYRKRLSDNQKKCDSGYYHRLDLEEHVIEYLANLPTKETELKKFLSLNKSEAFNFEAVKKELQSVNKKIDKENYLFRNDYIDEVELQKNVKNLLGVKKQLENQLNENKESKINHDKNNRVLELLKSGDIRTMDYEQQKKIVKTCISKILLTSDEITIILNF